MFSVLPAGPKTGPIELDVPISCPSEVSTRTISMKRSENDQSEKETCFGVMKVMPMTVKKTIERPNLPTRASNGESAI